GGWVTLSVLVLYVASYALGLGHVPWLVQSEMFDGSIRGRAAGVATGVNWTGNLVVSITFLSLTRLITAAGTFWLYGAISFLGLLAVYRWMPETKGKSLEEVRILF
ncbi:general substrate transporter, partial [Piptocephalis cylindrospora]